MSISTTPMPHNLTLTRDSQGNRVVSHRAGASTSHVAKGTDDTATTAAIVFTNASSVNGMNISSGDGRPQSPRSLQLSNLGHSTPSPSRPSSIDSSVLSTAKSSTAHSQSTSTLFPHSSIPFPSISPPISTELAGSSAGSYYLPQVTPGRDSRTSIMPGSTHHSSMVTHPPPSHGRPLKDYVSLDKEAKRVRGLYGPTDVTPLNPTNRSYISRPQPLAPLGARPVHAPSAPSRSSSNPRRRLFSFDRKGG
ncbi:hypothetical protein BCR39DRAFT_542447 [Naematelia encephala]|uniref:Uncharacterized protein n=1 Tax=Naematelia encephala TaxID=71784 RepID=A0A1Y2AU35_9TREE|nr:hypothetical protein BCR39DRAFT_542447 [Naematelia encephala]